MRLLPLLLVIMALTDKPLHAQSDLYSQFNACADGQHVPAADRIMICSQLLRSAPLTEFGRVAILNNLGDAYVHNGDPKQGLRYYVQAKFQADMTVKNSRFDCSDLRRNG